MTINDHLKEIWANINNINNWDAPEFDWKKAYVASVFANIAYRHIPEYELKNVDRANLIPCAEYRQIIENPNRIGVEQMLRDADIQEYFIVERPQAVAIVIKIQDVIFISLRGTQLYSIFDWSVNLNFFKSRPCPYANSSLYFHKGFHRAIASCMYEIYLEILKRFGEKNTIYATGHSLGGALAAILHATWTDRLWRYNPYDNRHFLPIHSCYTFGMPRFGSFDAVNYFQNPFHIYNQVDIVPTLPPKFLGFDDSLIEYCLTSENKVDETNIKGNSFPQFIYRLATTEGIQNHDMEIYIERTKNLANNPNNQKINKLHV